MCHALTLKKERNGNFEKNRKSDDLNAVWCEATRLKKQLGVDGHDC